MGKVNLNDYNWNRLLAWWRVKWGFCPACNSDAPLIDNCPVCLNYRGKYPPIKKVTDFWMSNFRGLRSLWRMSKVFNRAVASNQAKEPR